MCNALSFYSSIQKYLDQYVYVSLEQIEELNSENIKIVGDLRDIYPVCFTLSSQFCNEMIVKIRTLAMYLQSFEDESDIDLKLEYEGIKEVVRRKCLQNSCTCLLQEGVSLTPSGLLELLEGEAQLFSRGRILFRFLFLSSFLLNYSNDEEEVEDFSERNLLCTVTTHRIVFGSSNREKPRQLHLKYIVSAIKSGGPTLFHPRTKYKVVLRTISGDMIYLVFPLEDSSRESRDQMLNEIQSSLKRQLWLQQKLEEDNLEKRELKRKTQHKVGVGAILEQNQRRHQEAANVAKVAFDDIDSFMKEASQLAKVIQKYVATLEKQKEIGEEDLKLTNMLQNMGMASALTKEKLGDLYFDNLARQICDFLAKMKNTKNVLWKEGMMTLTDFYCIFNRARATNFISPQDLMICLDLCTELDLGFSKRVFDSGVIVIQDFDFDEDVMDKKLQTLVADAEKKSVTAMDVSRLLKINVILATEHLLLAEKREILCRDVTLEGIRFFCNSFLFDF